MAMPILSTKKLAKGNKGVWYHEKGGSIVDLDNAAKSDFVEAGGVHFIKLLVPRGVTAKRRPPHEANPAQPGFARQGAAA